MGRNNEKNIKKHNDKLHKEQDKAKAKKVARAEKLKTIVRKFNEKKKISPNFTISLLLDFLYTF